MGEKRVGIKAAKSYSIGGVSRQEAALSLLSAELIVATAESNGVLT
jgi:hypothetical protein